MSSGPPMTVNRPNWSPILIGACSGRAFVVDLFAGMGFLLSGARVEGGHRGYRPGARPSILPDPHPINKSKSHMIEDEDPFRANFLSDRETRPTCKTCPYWHLMDWSDSDFTWGLCVIRAPSTLPRRAEADTRPYARWPGTYADDFCGEHPCFPAWIASPGKP